MEMKDMKEFKWPSRLRSPPESSDKNKYCDYHRDHGYTTKDCITFQREIEALIKRRFLKEYIRHDKYPRNDRNNGKTTESGGAPNDMKDITFGSKDSEDITYSHDDALVIFVIIANSEVRRVLVDNGSAANVLSQEAFMKIGISVNQFKTVKTPLQGFGGGTIIPEGIVDLPLTLGSGQKQGHCIYLPSCYEVPISDGIGILRGDQKAARQCYVTCVRRMSTDVMQVLTLELELENQQKFVPEEELIEVRVEHSED
ncbi:uncharacterized protein LOC111371361 [Olea europaea var. sylvestris]|uniref:uncharacterized protein LOC111371361 n=1 Tax=Olea europaea var. sylvestris TaxID=158386 RepID=UPI000C1D2A19|nr:uncharacterized protein LOC111371361 [Olea europaea var. sylvestris]